MPAAGVAGLWVQWYCRGQAHSAEHTHHSNCCGSRRGRPLARGFALIPLASSQEGSAPTCPPSPAKEAARQREKVSILRSPSKLRLLSQPVDKPLSAQQHVRHCSANPQGHGRVSHSQSSSKRFRLRAVLAICTRKPVHFAEIVAARSRGFGRCFLSFCCRDRAFTL